VVKSCTSLSWYALYLVLCIQLSRCDCRQCAVHVVTYYLHTFPEKQQVVNTFSECGVPLAGDLWSEHVGNLRAANVCAKWHST